MITTDSYNEKLDMLKLFFHTEFPITEQITVYQPVLQDIIDYSEDEDGFMSMLHTFVGNTTFFRVALWDNGIDWNTISDFEMWCSFVKGYKLEQTKILFGDLDFQKFHLLKKELSSEEQDNKFEYVLYDPINDIEINELIYFKIRNYLRYMFGIFPKIQTGIKGKRVKEEYIRTDRIRARRANEKSSGSYFFPMISFCLNHPGFKYKKSELGQLGIVEFMDSVRRLQVTEECRAVLQGMMGGFVDGSKIKPEQYNFLKEINSIPKSLTQEISDTAKNPTNYNDALKQTLKERR